MAAPGCKGNPLAQHNPSQKGGEKGTGTDNETYICDRGQDQAEKIAGKSETQGHRRDQAGPADFLKWFDHIAAIPPGQHCKNGNGKSNRAVKEDLPAIRALDVANYDPTRRQANTRQQQHDHATAVNR